MATTLLKLFLGQGLAKDFLDLLFQLELSRTCEAWREGLLGQSVGVEGRSFQGLQGCSEVRNPRVLLQEASGSS